MHLVFDSDQRPGLTLSERARGWDESVAITEYQALWPIRFAMERRVLREALGGLAPRIEHVGSTAVAGLAARPIVDIAVGLTHPQIIDAHAARLRNFGFLSVAAGHAGSQRMFIRRERGVRTYHVYVLATGSRDWHELLAFRDRLLGEPTLAGEYGRLKRQFAAPQLADLGMYREVKSAFVAAVLSGHPAVAAAPAELKVSFR
jgi:GrpB-like predicted nucleotidyltransferase (UPF0157 family)